MNTKRGKMLLVGDNPFHGISHLSQERARKRASDTGYAAQSEIVLAAIDCGAEGFMFSVSDTTLSILRHIRESEEIERVGLYGIVPYAYEYVRLAAQTGTPGLARKMVKQMALSGHFKSVLGGVGAAIRMKPESLLKTYLAYEISRIASSAGSKAKLNSLLLHEVITDMSLALNFDWLFRLYISYLSKRHIIPGFNTRNFPYLVRRFEEWGFDLEEIIIATQFNKVGFQMNPSREECERVLEGLSSPAVIAISVLAAGYLKPPEAAGYLTGLENLRGLAVGASTMKQARETFSLFNQRLNGEH